MILELLNIHYLWLMLKNTWNRIARGKPPMNAIWLQIQSHCFRKSRTGYLSRCLLSFMTIKALIRPIMRLRDFCWRSNSKTSHLIPNQQCVWAPIICSISQEIYTRLCAVYPMKCTDDYVQYIPWNIHVIMFSISHRICTRLCRVHATKYIHDYVQYNPWNIRTMMYSMYPGIYTRLSKVYPMQYTHDYVQYPMKCTHDY